MHSTGSDSPPPPPGGGAGRLFPLPSRRATTRLGAAIAGVLAPGALVRLDGPLGAGKTFLVRALVRALGLGQDVPITSPTFALVHEHETPRGLVVHADLYRLRDAADERAQVAALALDERRAAGALVLVEWAAGLDRELGGAPELVVELHVADGVRAARLAGPLADRVLAAAAAAAAPRERP